MNATAQVKEWATPLRSLASGISIASFILAPMPILSRQVDLCPIQGDIDVEIITTLPDGGFNPHTLYYCSLNGLRTASYLEPTLLPNDAAGNTNIPAELRDLSGLPIETLAHLADVSRVTFHKWLNGENVSKKTLPHLKELLATLQTLKNLRGADLRSFLETPGIAGKPVDLLTDREYKTVIGLALYPAYKPTTSSAVSEAARQISGLPSWVRPATRLAWSAPPITDTERDKAIEELSPSPVPNEPELSTDEQDSEPAFIAGGFLWE